MDLIYGMQYIGNDVWTQMTLISPHALLEKYDGMLDSMGTLSQSLQWPIRNARNNIWLSLPQQGISKLPNEIIAYIMEIVHDSYGSSQVDIRASPFIVPDRYYIFEMGRTVSVLSCVSRRFRYVALGTSYLWSTILVKRSFPCELFIQRSGDGPLNVTYDFPVDKTLHTIVHDQRKRWKSLDIRHPELHLWDILNQDDLVFPALESLAVRPHRNFTSLDIYWQTPVLKHLVAYDCLMRVSMATNLVSLCIILVVEGSGIRLEDFKRNLMTSLAECKVLKVLKLTWWRSFYSVIQWDDKASHSGRTQHPIALMPSLESLHLNHDLEYQPEFGACLKGIQMPMLNKLCITGNFHDKFSGNSLLVHLLGDLGPLDSVRILMLDIDCTIFITKSFEVPFEYIEQYMPMACGLILDRARGTLDQLADRLLPSLHFLWSRNKSNNAKDDILEFVESTRMHNGEASPLTLKMPLKQMKKLLRHHYDDMMNAVKDDMIICHFHIDD